RVGPASAGAVPGPACYGRGGTQPTVTDANLLLGRLLADSPLAGDVQLDLDAAERAVGGLAGELGLEPRACAEGIVRVAEAEMLGALRVMTVERGIDPREYALMPFGGAGPLHAAALADELGISRILCPRASGVLCALGLAAAAPRRDIARTVMLRADGLSRERLDLERDRLVAEAADALEEAPTRVRARHELRYRGQSFELSVEEELRLERPRGAGLEPEALWGAFAEAHERRYGYRDDDGEVELVNIRVSVWGRAPELRPEAATANGLHSPRVPGERRPIVLGGVPVQAEIHRGEPPPGAEVGGPALWALPEATLLVPAGWLGSVDPHGTIHLRRGARGD
ncbi:MAG TPA: hydantoinase/oxoprolinase family protein, partial [Solirubrobacteraceae bacterium]|nr:hydantoinase/oxoprolinase family protein [Solirubrobacteraceae bacterium]